MNRLEEVLKNKKSFIPFITAGDPSLDITEQLILEMERAGADVIEIGIPFSDPMAEGEVIGRANERALTDGCTTDKIFDMIEDVRSKSQIPLVLLTYINPVYTYGKERFFRRCKEVGIDGIIVPDVPYEERMEIREECNIYEIPLITLIAPTSKDRIHMLAKEGEGYIYLVSSLGVTGVRSEITTNIDSIVHQIREVSNVPVALGFGISTSEQVKEYSAYVDGIIVGSKIVSLIETYKEGAVPYVSEYVARMKNSL